MRLVQQLLYRYLPLQDRALLCKILLSPTRVSSCRNAAAHFPKGSSSADANEAHSKTSSKAAPVLSFVTKSSIAKSVAVAGPPPNGSPPPVVWCGCGLLPSPPLWCGVVWLWPPPCGVVWFGCGLWWFPPFPLCGVVWVGWFPPACLDLLGVFGKPMLMMILMMMMMMTIIMIIIITIILVFLWLVVGYLLPRCLLTIIALLTVGARSL